MKRLCSEIDLISTLVNTSCMQIVRCELICIFRHRKRFSYIRCNIISFVDRFSWLWCFLQAMSTLTFCASFTPCNPKVQYSYSPLWTSRFWPPNSPDLNPFHHKNTRATSLPCKRAGCEWFEAAPDWCVSWTETERYWQCHWLAHSSHAPENISSSHCDTN